MLSFFEMLNLLEARAKRKTAKDALVDAGASTPAEVEPVVPEVPATPKYSKENPHPDYGKLKTYRSGEFKDGIWQPYDDETRAAKELEFAQAIKQGQSRPITGSGNREAILEKQKKEKALKDYQLAWDNFSSVVRRLSSSGVSAEDIPGHQETVGQGETEVTTVPANDAFIKLNQAAREYDPTGEASYNNIQTAIEDVLDVGYKDPFADGDEDAKPVSQLSKKEMEKIRREEEARQRASQTQMGATGDMTQGQARYAADLVPMWNDWMKGRTYRVFTKMAIKDLGIKVDGPAVVSGMLEEDSDEYFKIALYTSRNEKSGPDEVIMTASDFLKVKNWVTENMGFEGKADGSIDGTASFRQALAAGMDESIELSPIVLRALKLEKHLLNRSIVDRKTTIGDLAANLARLAKTDLVGGLDPVNEADDLNEAAVSYMIHVSQTSKRLKDAFIGSEKRGSAARIFAGKKATIVTPSGPKTRANAGISDEIGPEKGRVYQRKFDIFEVAPKADLSDPKTEVRVRPPKEIAEIDTRDDNPYVKRNFAYGSQVDRLMSQFGRSQDSGQTSLPPPRSNSGDQPPKPKIDLDDLDLESTDLSDLMTVMEYWNK